MYRVAVQSLVAPPTHRTIRLYCPATSSTPAVHAVQLDRLPGAAALLAACSSGKNHHLAFAASAPGVSATLQAQHQRVLLTCAVPPVGTTQRFLVVAYSAAGGRLLEAWEVFLHCLPVVCLAANAGSAATTTRLLSSLDEGPRATTSCHWLGCGPGELQARVGSGSGDGGGGRPQLALRFEPRRVARREVLLSVAAAGAGQQRRQAALLLLDLDSSATRISRSFEVVVRQGQVVSKKVHFCSPHPEPQLFRVCSLAPLQLHIAPAAATGFELAGGESAPIKMTFNAEGCHSGSQLELLAVIESAPAEGGAARDPTTGSGDCGSWRVGEVFCVRLSVA